VTERPVPELNIERNRDSEKGSVLLVALMVMVVLSLLGVAFLLLSNSETTVAGNALWAEGSFYAAEAGVQAGINQLSANRTTATAAIAVTSIGGSSGTGDVSYSYRSGTRTDTSAQPLTFIGTRTATGYSVEGGTGYNPAGYDFYIYQMNVTGTGPRNTAREIEVQAEYGPVPK
jgi:Tfp pilus assembly protein PilX